jgi:DNA-binding winged helix-turn-helix (wHTH) protein/TolB-like protein/Tfp pilus assembly protein PilF
MPLKAKHFRFGNYRLYPGEHLLLREDTPIPLQPKTFDILLMLVENAGYLVTRDELMKAVWRDSFVEESNLTVNISLLRKALGDMGDGRPYIDTVPRKGYRFNAEVAEGGEAAPAGDDEGGELTQPSTGQEGEGQSGGIAELGRGGAEPGPVQRGADTGRNRRGRHWIGSGIAGVVLAFLLIYAWPHLHGHPSAVGAAVQSVAILPFQPLEATPDDEYLGLGIADALITRLCNLHQVAVRPLGAIRKYAGTDDPVAAGRQLAVQSVLEGSVHRQGERTRVTARLLRVADGEVLWAGQFDEKVSDMFQVEDSISQELASALTLKLTGDEQKRFAHSGTGNGDAYQLYLRGRFYWDKRSADGVRRSLDYFGQAIHADPNYALAYAGLADAYILAGSYGYTIMPPKEAMPKAKEAAQKALALDEQLGEAHASLAYIEFTYDWDWSTAENEFKRAIALNPNYDTARHWYSHELTALGRQAESMEQARRALELSPGDVVMNEHMGWQYMMAENYSAAIAPCEKALQIDPNFLLGHRVLALSYMYLGRYPEAIAEFQKGVAISHNDPVARAYLARGLAASGSREEARQILHELLRTAKEGYVAPAEVAAVYTALGDRDHAFEWLNKAYGERTSSLVYLKVDRAYETLRNDSRYKDLLAKMNLE